MITLEQLAKRDKWICHICEQRVERLSDATREHLVPKAYGGTNANSNLALAHIWCNKAKGHKIFRAEQHGTGWVVVDPNGSVISDEYPTHVDAYAVATDMNRDKRYMDPYYAGNVTENQSDIVIIRRVQDHSM